MDAKASQARKSHEARWVYEAEAKAKKEYVGTVCYHVLVGTDSDAGRPTRLRGIAF